MKPSQEDADRPAITIVSGVERFLKIQAEEDVLGHAQVVNGLQDHLVAVIELAVADVEVEPARGQVFAVVLAEAVAAERHAELVVRPAPGAAVDPYPQLP